jgi:fumarate reductase subunit C
MAPSRRGATRTAPPQRPPKFPLGGRYAAYTLFDATGLVYLLVGFVALRAVWALGEGEAAWQEILRQYQHPLYIAFHALCLASVVFVGVRFFRLFPKSQPPRIGPLRPPPGPAIHTLLYAAWVGVTAAMVAILAGAVF